MSKFVGKPFTRESYEIACKAIHHLPNGIRGICQRALDDEVDRQLFPEWHEQKKKLKDIRSFPMQAETKDGKVCRLAETYGEYCDKAGIDWQTGYSFNDMRTFDEMFMEMFKQLTEKEQDVIIAYATLLVEAKEKREKK